MIALLALCLTQAWPTPAEAGFHQCALIYNAPERTADDLAWYVADDTGWLFDAFLFLIYSTPSGRQPISDPTVLEDWQFHLDRWFAPDRDVAELEKAVAAAAGRLGPVAPRQVMFSIPRLNPAVTDFGDVDGDGVSESLATPEGRGKVLNWYLDALKQRFAALAPAHLQFWGGYIMAESLAGPDQPIAREMADACHARGLKLLWIPWYVANGWQHWRECGIDVAIMQPNYAFLSLHGGRRRRDRLANCADLAQRHGMGVEIEIAADWRDPGSERLWRHYLADGAAARWGYQQAPTAWYMSTRTVEEMARSTVPREQAMYAALKAYVKGETVPDPDPPLAWRGPGGALSWLGDQLLTLPGPAATPAWLEAQVPAAGEGGTVDLLFDRQAGPGWSGELVVESVDAAGQATPVGWAIAPPPLRSPDNPTRFQALTVPVDGPLERLRLRLEGPPATSLAEVSWSPLTAGGRVRHAALGAPYTWEPAGPAAYGDDGTQLTDGYVTERGYGEHRSVGWHGRDVAVDFDLGSPTPLAAAEVILQGGGTAAIQWPADAVLLYSATAPPPTGNVANRAVEGVGWVAARDVEILRTRAPNDHDGRLRFELPAGATPRYLSLHFGGQAWLMLHEIRLLSPDGENLALGRPYTVMPQPTLQAGASGYADDGRRLTDGVILQRLNTRGVSGWNDDEPRTITVTLAREAAHERVTVWALAGGQWGIWAPAEVAVAVSTDGYDWRNLPAQPHDPPVEEGGPAVGVGYGFDAAGAPFRLVRVTARRSKTWAMLSEIQVD